MRELNSPPFGRTYVALLSSQGMASPQHDIRLAYRLRFGVLVFRGGGVGHLLVEEFLQKLLGLGEHAGFAFGGYGGFQGVVSEGGAILGLRNARFESHQFVLQGGKVLVQNVAAFTRSGHGGHVILRERVRTASVVAGQFLPHECTNVHGHVAHPIPSSRC